MSTFVFHSDTHFDRVLKDLSKAFEDADITLPANFHAANCLAFMLGHVDDFAYAKAVRKALSEHCPPPLRDEHVSITERQSRFKFQSKRLTQHLLQFNVRLDNARAFVEVLQATGGHRHHSPLNAEEIASDAKDRFFVRALDVVLNLKKSKLLPSEEDFQTIRRGVLCALQSKAVQAQLLPLDVGELAVSLANTELPHKSAAASELFDILAESRFWVGVAHAAQNLLRRLEEDEDGRMLKRALNLTGRVDAALAAGEEVFQTKDGLVDFWMTKAALLERRGAPGDEEVMLSYWREVGRLGRNQGVNAYMRYCEDNNRVVMLSDFLPPLPQFAVDAMNAWMNAPDKDDPHDDEPSARAV